MVKENLASCLKRIDVSLRRGNRDPSEVTLVAVTKGVEALRVKEAIGAGVRHIGENRIQEALLKREEIDRAARLAQVALTWHMLGHLQTNKVKDAVCLFDLIHSVDSVRLAEAIDKEAGKVSKTQDILLEVNVSKETSKYGFAPDDVGDAAQKIALFSHVRVRGLMTVAPIVDDPEKARPYFRRLKDISTDVFLHPPSSMDHGPFLSMGMTDDFEVAVQEGATHVRIGRGIFGLR
jgi:pyridoxal phosphate enzyme (YggS family)